MQPPSSTSKMLRLFQNSLKFFLLKLLFLVDYTVPQGTTTNSGSPHSGGTSSTDCLSFEDWYQPSFCSVKGYIIWQRSKEVSFGMLISINLARGVLCSAICSLLFGGNHTSFRIPNLLDNPLLFERKLYFGFFIGFCGSGVPCIMI